MTCESSAPHARAVASVLGKLKSEGGTRLTGFTAHGDTDAVKQLARAGEFDVVQAYFSAANPSSGFAGVSGG